MRILSFTAGAGEMLCGSCIRDNALARALAGRGHEVRLVPLYQRSRTDETSVSETRVRFGGISVFLQHAAPLFGALPGLDRVLDSPAMLGLVERFSSSTDPTRLGPLTVTTLEGAGGPARRAVEALADSVRDAGPDVVVLPNSLLLGLAAPLAAATGAPVVVTFSGEDLFLARLPARDRERALGLMREAAEAAQHFVGVTEHHALAMAETLGIPHHRVSFVRLGVDAAGYPAEPKPAPAGTGVAAEPVTIGFFSRIAPEKGLDRLADAVLQLAGQPGTPPLRVRAAGWMNRAGRAYLEEVRSRFGSGATRIPFEYRGELDHEAKIEFLRGADVIGIPATFPEPKGIPAIEAMMAGTPVVVPQQGAYPALLDRAEGGVLAKSSEPEPFAAALSQLVLHPERRASVGARGFRRVREEHSVDRMAEDAEAAFGRALAA
jgi:glycosyltransferase involved in cell wall biosynthesis